MKHALSLLLALLLGGCTALPLQKDVEDRAAALRDQSASRTFLSTDAPYLGGTPVSRATIHRDLDREVSFKSNGTLDAVVQGLASVLPIPFRVDLRSNAPVSENAAPAPTPRVSVNYAGRLPGLLDQLASLSDTAWTHEPAEGVTFYRYAVQTFNLLASPVKASYENTITSRSRETSVTSGLGGSSGASGESQTAQTNTSEYHVDVWADVENAVRNVLSPDGKATSNPSLGTITVSDKASVLRQVSKLIASYNANLSRQVAWAVHAWALDVSGSRDFGLDVAAALQAGGVSLGSSLQNVSSGVGQLSAALVDGNWQGTTAIAQAMVESGKATQISGGSGITMSNQPAPIQNVKTQGYIQSVTSSSYSDSSETSYSISPGEITHGFSMTIIPMILDRRRLILQYNIAISSLDRMEDFSVGDMRVQIPTVSTKSFAQRVSMRMGQTLILAGFIQDRESSDGNAGFLNFSLNRARTRTLIVITIDVESFGEPLIPEETTVMAGGIYD